MRNPSSLSLEKIRWLIILITVLSLQSTGAIFCYKAKEEDEEIRHASAYAVPVNIFISEGEIYITPVYGVEFIQNNSEMLEIMASGDAPRLKEPETDLTAKTIVDLSQIRKLYVLDNIIIATLVQDKRQMLSSSVAGYTNDRARISDAVLDEIERNIQKDNPLQAIYIPPEPDKKLMEDLIDMKLEFQQPLMDCPFTPSVPAYKILARIYSPSNPVPKNIKSAPADLEIWIQGMTCDCINEDTGCASFDDSSFHVCSQCISLIDKGFSAIIERWQSLTGLSVKPLLITDKSELLPVLLTHSCPNPLPDDSDHSMGTAYLQPLSLLDQLLITDIAPDTTPALSVWRPSKFRYRTNQQHKKLTRYLGGDHQYNTPSPVYVYTNEKLDIELYRVICREVKRINSDQDEMQDACSQEKLSLLIELNQWITGYKKKYSYLPEKDIYTLCYLIYELVLYDYDDIARRVIERYGFDFKIFRKYINMAGGVVDVDTDVMGDSYVGMDADVDMDEPIDKQDNLLLFIIKKNKLNLLYYLLSFGGSAGDELLVRFKDLDTVFHFACKESSADCLKILLELGVKLLGSELLEELLNKVDVDGRRCLHLAVDRQSYEMCVQLLRYNADCNAKTVKESFTPLHLAAKKNLLEIVELLLKQPAIDPRLKSRSHKTAYTETKNSRIKSLVNNSIQKVKRKKQEEEVEFMAEEICHINLKRKPKKESSTKMSFKKRKVKAGKGEYDLEKSQSLFFLNDLAGVNAEAIDSDDRRKHYYCPPVLCINAYKQLVYIIDRKQMPVTVIEQELLDKMDRNIQILYCQLYDASSMSGISDEAILKTPLSLISDGSQLTELEEISLAFKQDGGLHKKINYGKDINYEKSISAFMPDEIDISESMLCYFISSIDNILKSPVKGFEKYRISHHDIINHLIKIHPDATIVIVGGAIRDTLQYIFTHQRPMEERDLSTDIDIQTSLTEEQITSAFDQLLQERDASESERANFFIKRESGYVGFGYPDNAVKLDTFNAGKLFYAVRNCSFTINSNFFIYRPHDTSVLYIKSPMSFNDVFTKTIRFRENWFDASATSTKVPGMILRALDFLRRGYTPPEDNGMTVYAILRALHMAFEEVERLDRAWLLDFIQTTKNESPLKDKILYGQLLNEYPSVYTLFLELMRLGHFSCLSLDGLVSSSGNLLVAAERFMQKKCNYPGAFYKLIGAFYGILAKPQYLPLKKAFAKDIQKLHQLLYAIQLGMSSPGFPVPASIMLAEAALASCPEKTDSLPYEELFDGMCKLKTEFSNEDLSSGIYCLLYEKMNKQFCDQGLELTSQRLKQLINRSLPFDKSSILDSLFKPMEAIGIKN